MAEDADDATRAAETHAENEDDVASLKAFAIKMSRDPNELPDARGRALMACLVIPAVIQQWMIDAGALEPLLDSIEKTILAAEAHARLTAPSVHRREGEGPEPQCPCPKPQKLNF